MQNWLVAHQIPAGHVLKIKLEVDTDLPPGFATHTRYLLHPIPFAVRCYTLPDLFAGKMHALLFRRWKKRVKVRDWYDFVWYAANHPRLILAHLEQRMWQTDHLGQPVTNGYNHKLTFAALSGRKRLTIGPCLNILETIFSWGSCAQLPINASGVAENLSLMRS